MRRPSSWCSLLQRLRPRPSRISLSRQAMLRATTRPQLPPSSSSQSPSLGSPRPTSPSRRPGQWLYRGRSQAQARLGSYLSRCKVAYTRDALKVTLRRHHPAVVPRLVDGLCRALPVGCHSKPRVRLMPSLPFPHPRRQRSSGRLQVMESITGTLVRGWWLCMCPGVDTAASGLACRTSEQHRRHSAGVTAQRQCRVTHPGFHRPRGLVVE